MRAQMEDIIRNKGYQKSSVISQRSAAVDLDQPNSFVNVHSNPKSQVSGSIRDKNISEEAKFQMFRSSNQS